jgi:hypothetical protein
MEKMGRKSKLERTENGEWTHYCDVCGQKGADLCVNLSELIEVSGRFNNGEKTVHPAKYMCPKCRRLERGEKGEEWVVAEEADGIKRRQEEKRKEKTRSRVVFIEE